MKKVKETAVAGNTGVVIEKRNIEVITSEILFYKHQAGEAILEIGRRLNEAKEQLEHGQWLGWLQEKVDFSDATAQRFMRIAREYENPSPVTDLGIAKAVALLALPAAERDEFVTETHEVDGKEKTVDEMSKRELEKAVRERKEALEAKDVAERQTEEQRRATQEALDRAAEADADAKRAEGEKAELERQLEELRNTKTDLPPEPDQQTLDAVRKEAAAEGKREAETELKAKIEKADTAKKKAETSRKEAEDELKNLQAEGERQKTENEKLRKSLAVANSGDAVAFKVHFENAQGEINKMLGYIQKADEEQGGKFAGALRALCEKVLASVPATGGDAT